MRIVFGFVFIFVVVFKIMCILCVICIFEKKELYDFRFYVFNLFICIIIISDIIWCIVYV